MKWLLSLLYIIPQLAFGDLGISTESFVSDKAALLSLTEKQNLEKKLENYTKKSKNHIYIILTKDKKGQVEDSSLAFLLHSLEGINQAVIIHCNVYSNNYDLLITNGLKQKFPDWAVENIKDNILKKNFKSGNYFIGLTETVDTMIGISNGSKNLDELKNQSSGYIFVVLMMAIGFFVLVFPVLQFNAMKKAHFATKSVDFVSTIVIMNSFGTRGKNLFDNFSRARNPFEVKNSENVPQKGGGGIAGYW